MRVEDAAPIHASAFAYRGAGCLLLGASGMGKSRMVAEALAHGAQLIADDQLQLRAHNGQLMAEAMPTLAGVLELRGLGLIRCAHTLPAHPVHLAVMFDAAAHAERLPELRTREFAGIAVPYVTLHPLPETSVAALLVFLEAVADGRTLSTDWRPER